MKEIPKTKRGRHEKRFKLLMDKVQLIHSRIMRAEADEMQAVGPKAQEKCRERARYWRKKLRELP